MLRRVGAAASVGGRCRRRQHVPLRPRRLVRRDDPSRTLRGRVRRGARARGHHEHDVERADRARVASSRSVPSSGGSSPTATRSPRSSTSATSCAPPWLPTSATRLPTPYPDDLQAVLLGARGRVERALDDLMAIDPQLDDAKQKRLRAQLVAGALIDSIDVALAGPSAPPGSRVDFVSGSRGQPAPGGRSARRRPAAARGRVGAANGDPHERHDSEVADANVSDFPRQPSTRTMSAVRSTTPSNALLYCAMSLPDPRHPGYRDAVHDELAALITAAGGRTLALFTSWAAMDAAAAALARPRRRPVDHAARSAQAGAAARLRRRRGDHPAGHRRVLPGRRRAWPHPHPGRHRSTAVPPSRRPVAVGADASSSAQPPSARSTSPGRR